jgi:hypothetical protein
LNVRMLIYPIESIQAGMPPRGISGNTLSRS